MVKEQAAQLLLQYPEHSSALSIQERFEAFHKLNPWVAGQLVRLARKYLVMGRPRVGIKHLFEILRWDYAASTQGADFKLDNNFPSRYVRLISAQTPEIAHLFEQRQLRAA